MKEKYVLFNGSHYRALSIPFSNRQKLTPFSKVLNTHGLEIPFEDSFTFVLLESGPKIVVFAMINKTATLSFHLDLIAAFGSTGDNPCCSGAERLEGIMNVGL